MSKSHLALSMASPSNSSLQTSFHPSGAGSPAASLMRGTRATPAAKASNRQRPTRDMRGPWSEVRAWGPLYEGALPNRLRGHGRGLSDQLTGSGQGLVVFQVPDPAGVQPAGRHRQVRQRLPEPPVRPEPAQLVHRRQE